MDGRKDWRILPPPLPGILWVNPSQPCVPHGIQCGGGRRDPELDYGGSADGGDYPRVGSIILCGLWVG